MFRTCTLLIGWSAAAFAATGSSRWCVGPPLAEDDRVAKRVGAEFRGSFRGLSLWIEEEEVHALNATSSCERFGGLHTEYGNDGLWVVE